MNVYSRWCVLLSMGLLVVAGGVQAAKIYKWVDENGEVHFSQTPPPRTEGKETPKAEVIRKARTSHLSPVIKGDNLYCGDMRLPKDSGRRPFTVDRLASHRASWEKSLKRARDSLDRFMSTKSTRKSYSGRYGSSYGATAPTYHEQREQHTQKVAKFDCAIAWANGRIESLRSTGTDRALDYEKAQKDVEVAKGQLHRVCGPKPASYNKYGTQRDVYLSWKQCRRKNIAVVREMEQKLAEAKRRYTAAK